MEAKEGEGGRGPELQATSVPADARGDRGRHAREGRDRQERQEPRVPPGTRGGRWKRRGAGAPVAKAPAVA